MSIVEKAMRKRRQAGGEAPDGASPSTPATAPAVSLPPAVSDEPDADGAGLAHPEREGDAVAAGELQPFRLPAGSADPDPDEAGSEGVLSAPERAMQRLRGASADATVSSASVATPSRDASAAAPDAEPDLTERSVEPAAIAFDDAALRRAGLWPEPAQAARIRDQFRRIKRPLLASAFGINAEQLEHGNLIMVASALPGEGKSFTSFNLATSIANELDRTVLLVDADVARPHVTHALAQDRRRGLIDVLSSPDCLLQEVILPTSVAGMRFLPAGSPHDHATELLASERMAILVQELSERYADRVIIFDTPPLVPTTEAQAMAHLMGQIVLVVHASHTPQSAVFQALESIDGPAAISVVLNKTRANWGEEYGAYAYGDRY